MNPVQHEILKIAARLNNGANFFQRGDEGKFISIFIVTVVALLEGKLANFAPNRLPQPMTQRN
eukprot:GAFH01004894.1.p5 GENE.GAFH01004894.1~~GAFH01004894.1.p5  ORF type:complete len:63 (-),score=7.82 GAFH01004894.1:118-306(-)